MCFMIVIYCMLLYLLVGQYTEYTKMHAMTDTVFVWGIFRIRDSHVGRPE